MYVLPIPSRVEQKEGTFFLTREVRICIDHRLGVNANYYADLLKREIADILGFSVSILRTDKKRKGCGIYLAQKSEGKSEAYHLSIDKTCIQVTGDDEAGLLYGVQTLRQLVREYGAFLPLMEIKDEPKMQNRGYSHDVTRGRIPTLSELKRLADTCSFYKLNLLQLNVEHSYLFQNESEVWRASTPLTAEEIMEFDAYCQSLHIDLVPTLASFGHLYELLRTRTYEHLCELEIDREEPFSLIDRMEHHTVDVTNEESLELIKSRIREYMNLFSSKYFNICADETFDLGKGKSKDVVQREGAKTVYVGFLKKLCDFVISCGRIPLFWGDIIVEKPEIITMLPKEGICLNWEYSPLVKEDNLRKLSEAGAQNIYVCPGVQSWDGLINKHTDAYLNICGMCANAHKYRAKGVVNTDWGDLGHIAHPEFSTIGLIYGAAFSWNDEVLAQEECNKRISLIQYGDDSEKLVNTFQKLGDQACVGWWSFVRYKEKMQKKETSVDVSFADLVMNAEMAEKAQEKIQQTDLLTEQLYRCLPRQTAKTKCVIYAYILMAEGQKLIGQICVTLLGIQTGKRYMAAVDPKELASAWEEWFMKYKDLWRSTSKESELFHLAEVIFWYADLLRDSAEDGMEIKGKEISL